MKSSREELFGEQYLHVMGGNAVSLVPAMIGTTEEDNLRCPYCSKSRLLTDDR